MNTIEILIIDDNYGDARLTMEILKENKVTNKCFHVKDGIEALRYLHKEEEFSDANIPDLILLDLNMPKMNGLQFLEIIKNEDELKIIPIVVLTTSTAKSDILDAYKSHANSFICKPVDLERFVDIIKSIDNFWFNVVKIPTK